MQSNFRVDVRSENGAPLLSVKGELDLASSPALEEEVERAVADAAPLIIIDLRELEFMDSTGLSVLIRAHQRTQERGHRLAIVNGSRQVRRLLSLTGVAERLTIVDRPEQLQDLGGQR
jgi:anti-sigma B factor antagonist